MNDHQIIAARLCGAPLGTDLSGCDVDDRTDEWIDVAIPGDVRSALVAAGRLEDPDRDPTDRASAWVDELEWWYRFALPAVPAADTGGSVVLRFAGIDTFATVFIDGQERASSTNMFRTVEVDVTDVAAEEGPHVVAVRIERPWAAVGYDAASRFDDRRHGARTPMRKAQFGHGWDFAPTQPSIGLWRPVTVVRRGETWLEGVRFQTVRLDTAGAVVTVDAFVAGAPCAGTEVDITLHDPDGVAVVEATVTAVEGVARLVASLRDPQLWWPHTHGRPALYALSVDVRTHGRTVDAHSSRVGVRTVALDESPDPDEVGGRLFRFLVNGRAIFARGANWVPCDMAVGAVAEAQYRPLLEQARDAHMDMVRIWGGGVYEHDVFYDLCDELGLLVWQDFMFACAPVADEDDEWLAEIRAEATDQVRRLRSHACLALWCGNNEIEGIALIRDPDLRRTPSARIFHGVLPEVVAAEDGVVGYVSSSPLLGNDSDQGDRHSWDVWHGLRARSAGGAAFDDLFASGAFFDSGSDDGRAMAAAMAAEQYLDDRCRFSSEFGLRSLPARATLAAWIAPEHLHLDDPQITGRNRDTLGPANKVELLAARVFAEPTTLDELIDVSQLVQAEGLKLGCEHYRRRRPHCGGALIWQLNDCWPGATWSLIDHSGRAKGALSYAARFFAPVVASFVAEPDGSASLWVVNDTDRPFLDTLTVRLHRFDHGDEWSVDVAVEAPALTSQPVRRWSADELQAGLDRCLVVSSSTGALPRNRLLFGQPGELRRDPAKVAATYDHRPDGRMAVTLAADGYALFAHVLCDDPTVRFDDNHLDLESGSSHTITTLTPVSPDTTTFEVRWL